MGSAVAVVWLIESVLVLEVEVANPFILKAGHFQSRYRALAPKSLPGNLPADVLRQQQAGA
jgi:hypothetical protein